MIAHTFMETRFVTIPANIELSVDNPMTGKPTKAARDFYSLVKDRTNDAGYFGKSLDALMMGLAIRQAFTECKPGDIIGLPLEQWEVLCKAFREPSTGYNPEVMFQLLPMVRAVLDAPSTRPETKAKDIEDPSAEASVAAVEKLEQAAPTSN